MESGSRLIAGCEEWCAFSSLGVPAVKARVDSGARTSALHAVNIKSFTRSNRRWVSFEVHPLQNDRITVLRCEAPVHDRRPVKNSGGVAEKRFIIKTEISISGHSWEIDLSLANRDNMGYRMLLGREAMGDRMLVDPAGSFLLGAHTDKEISTIYARHEHSKDGLKIGLLASNPDLYSNQRIVEAGRERGHDIRFFDIRQCYMKLDADTPEVHTRGGILLNDLDAVIPRIRPAITFYGCALTRHFESMGIPTLNTSQAVSRSRDKLYSLQLLLKEELDIPVTGFASSPMDTDELIEMVGGAPLIIKLLEGTQGRGVVLAETRKAAESVINAFKSLNANLLVQEFVSEADGKDLRLFVVEGKVVAAMQRQAAPGEFRANMHRGGTAIRIRPTPEERKLAVRAARSMGLHVAGVDIIRSKNGPLLLEINSAPGLQGIEEVTGKDIAAVMISAVERMCEWKRKLTGETGDLSVEGLNP
ncbi:alpha-L-glutamate ligase [Chromatiales bacterium (ex Bugula neritina AB1)]|nr:alpha-L-glutamate ligase [Chromatiales bacterium (ex Bugula neritina AB1)]